MKNGFAQDALLARPLTGIMSQCKVLRTTSILDDSGQVWREQKRLLLQLINALGFVKEGMEERVAQEVSYLVEKLDEIGDKPTDIHKILGISFTNIIGQFLFGHRFEATDPRFDLLLGFLDKILVVVSQIGIFSNIPLWLSGIIVKIFMVVYKNVIEKTFSLFE